MWGIVAVGVVKESRKFSGHHVYGALRGHLCDSTAFLFTLMLYIVLVVQLPAVYRLTCCNLFKFYGYILFLLVQVKSQV